MTSLSDKLKSLGVKLGSKDLAYPNTQRQFEYPIDNVLPGDWWTTPHGNAFYVETRYPHDFMIGKVDLKPTSSFEIIAHWANETKISELKLEHFAFIDTETTHLSSGSGTFAFMIGVGRFENDEFRLVQFFLQDPGLETAQLAAFEEFISPCEAFVSFNGKSFDLPIINTRFISNGWLPPFENYPHIDLLHLARRLWKSRLPSRALGDLEVNILGTKRSEEDVPGWMVPQLYFDYLHTGDARPLRRVFYHNEVDIISLAALLSHITKQLADPFNVTIDHGNDLVAIGKLYADIGFLDTASQIYQKALDHCNLTDVDFWNALKQLSFIHKKRGDVKNAMKLWKMAAENEQIYAYTELAKIYEHRKKDYQSALKWTQKGLHIIADENKVNLDQVEWKELLEHRKKRLERKLLKSNG